jgi:Tfp pilus assembly protein PilO
VNSLAGLTERWGQLPKQQRVLAAVLTPIIVFAVFYFLALAGLDSRLDTAKNGLQQQRQTQQDLEVEIRNRHVLEQELKLKKALVTEISRKIPMEADPGDLLDKVYHEAGAARLDLRVFKPESELVVKEMAFIINKADFSGSFHAIGEFLDRLIHIQRLVKVLAIKFARTRVAGSPQEDNLSNRLVGSATIAAFRLLRPDELAAAAALKKKRRR